VTDEAGVEAAARACFAARRGTPLDAILTGPLLRYAELFDGLPGFLHPLVWNAQVRHFRVTSLDGDAAFCDCDVVTVGDYSTPHGLRLRSVGRITAPLVLERTRAGWRVADYALNGRRLLRSIRLYEAREPVHVGDLTLAPLAVEAAAYGTVLLLEITNSTAHEVVVEQATIPGKGRIGPLLRSREYAVFAGERRIPPGRTREVVAVRDAAQPLTVPRLRPSLRLRRLEPEALMNGELDLPFADAPEPTLAAYDRA